MSTNASAEKAIQEWRTKHQIQETDPLVVGLELVQIYLNNQQRPTTDSTESQPSYQEFRETLLLLDKQSKVLDAAAKTLIEEFRRATQRFKGEKPVTTVSMLLIVTLSLTVGVLLSYHLK